jgi:hypothetical protein
MVLWLTAVAIAGTVDTPWGPMSERQARQLCDSAHVFIGTIAEVESFLATEGDYAGHTTSTVRWQVERNIHNADSPFVMDLPGGKIDTKIQLLEGYPVPLVGRRYLMVVDRWPRDVPPARAGDPWYKFSVELQPATALPELDTLQAARDAICGNLP